LVRKIKILAIVITVVITVSFSLVPSPSHSFPTAQASTQSASEIHEWSIAENYGLEAHSEGFVFPTTIVAIPDPGNELESPIYFVGELNGTIKAVTRSGQVHVFASSFYQNEFHTIETESALGQRAVEFGLGALCLDGESGYLFATYAYTDDNGQMRNGITRFASEPGRFGLTPSGVKSFNELLSTTEFGPSHQIGPCLARNGELFVTNGDGGHSLSSQDLTDFRGKILRMDFEGNAIQANPFFVEGSEGAKNYLYASGLRNPWGITTVGESEFVADNGAVVDRIVELQIGRNYLWGRGGDQSFALAAEKLLLDQGGIATIEFIGDDGSNNELSDLRNNLLVVRTKSPARIIAMELETNGQASSDLRTMVTHVGDGPQILSSMAVLEDGVYFAPLIPGEDGTSSVLRFYFAPDNPPHQDMSEIENGELLIARFGCVECHVINGEGGSIAPNLDEFQVARSTILASREYEDLLKTMNSDPNTEGSGANDSRARLLEFPPEARLNQWVVQRLLNPRFDDPTAIMPSLGLRESEAQNIADFIVSESPVITDTLEEAVEEAVEDPFFYRFFPEGGNYGRRWLAVYFIVGIGVTSLSFAALLLIFRTIQHKSTRKQK